MINDNCNPVYNETFEYLISKNELCNQKLIVTVKTKLKFLLHNKFIGQVSIYFFEFCTILKFLISGGYKFG